MNYIISEYNATEPALWSVTLAIWRWAFCWTVSFRFFLWVTSLIESILYLICVKYLIFISLKILSVSEKTNKERWNAIYKIRSLIEWTTRNRIEQDKLRSSIAVAIRSFQCPVSSVWCWLPQVVEHEEKHEKLSLWQIIKN